MMYDKQYMRNALRTQKNRKKKRGSWSEGSPERLQSHLKMSAQTQKECEKEKYKRWAT